MFAAYFTRQVAADQAAGTAQWGNAVSLAGLVVAIAGPVLGAAADQGGQRKPWIAGFTGVCVAATGLLWLVEPSPGFVPLALALLVIGIVGTELAGVFYNAMLPELVPPERVGRWSGWAWGFGYLGGLVCLTVALFALVKGGGSLGLDPGAAEPVRAT
ncbi:MAG: MFS transporter, partial [Candidatus Binatia bacterium]